MQPEVKTNSLDNQLHTCCYGSISFRHKKDKRMLNGKIQTDTYKYWIVLTIVTTVLNFKESTNQRGALKSSFLIGWLLENESKESIKHSVLYCKAM